MSDAGSCGCMLIIAAWSTVLPLSRRRHWALTPAPHVQNPWDSLGVREVVYVYGKKESVNSDPSMPITKTVTV